MPDETPDWVPSDSGTDTATATAPDWAPQGETQSAPDWVPKESVSDTPETDSALKQVQRYFDLEKKPQAPEQRSIGAKLLEGAGKGLKELIPKSVGGAVRMVGETVGGPLVGGIESIYQTGKDVSKVAAGAPIEETFQEKPFTQYTAEDWGKFIAQRGVEAAMAIPLFKGLRPEVRANILQKGGEPDAIQRSDAQIQAGETPLGIETRPEGGIPSPGDSDYVKREAQGKARGIPPESVPAGEPVAPSTQAEPNAPQLITATIPEGGLSIEKDAAPAKVNPENGSGSRPPPGSLVASDTPPGANPEHTWANRLTTKFRNWWEHTWPRTYAAFRLEPDTPAIAVHQQFIKDPVDFMESFAREPWWKNIKSMDETDIIDAEDTAVTRYRSLVEQGVDPVKARAAAMYESQLKYVFAHRVKMEPIENAAADELGVDRPGFTGDPYLARLTNEEGKEIVDVTPGIGNIGSQLKRSIGHFDNSRVHATMKAGIAEGTQYDPVTKAVWMRERVGQQLISTASALKSLKEGGVLHDTREAAKAAQIKGTKEAPVLVRGFGAKNYWARNRQEAKFIQQNFAGAPSTNAAWRRINQLGNSYIRNPSLINPLPHVTKNMFFKYGLARVGNARFKADVAEFSKAADSQLMDRFKKVFPMPESTLRMPQLTAREVGSWAEKVSARGLKINEPSQKFIFAKADPAMRYSLWKSYIRKGMGDQEAANHVFLDLIRYDENSGGLNFWKSIPLNYFSTWRTGTYVTMAKALRSHPIRTMLFIGGIEYAREMIYRKTGAWTHLPVDYMDAPLAESVLAGTRAKEGIEEGRGVVKSTAGAAESVGAVAATTLLFGPGGGQAPSTISQLMDSIRGDPTGRARVMNMFWGISQIYNMPQEFLAYKRDHDPKHLVMLLSSAAFSTHSALKYEPRRLAKWLPEWLPGMQKTEIVKYAEGLQERIRQRQKKGQATYESRHGITRGFQQGQEEEQLQDLSRAAGVRIHEEKEVER